MSKKKLNEKQTEKNVNSVKSQQRKTAQSTKILRIKKA